ncbi:hypothetical protein SLE2022_379820 [Rubroshorea leprosula]
MGAGRKTRTITVGEKSNQSSASVNSSVSARNLRESDLAGVIFGCKNETYEECLNKQLFGLPASHFSYVRNVQPGLPLFLFNYSDRKLHGIFEAVSRGQLRINPNAWTQDGSDNTPFPAQVKIQMRMQCRPLLEDEFKPIIVNNYHEPRLFWFELDRTQTNNLIALFSASPITASSSHSKKVKNWNTSFKSSRDPCTKQEGNRSETSALATQKQWSALFKDQNAYDTRKRVIEFDEQTPDTNLDCDQLNMKQEFFDPSHCWDVAPSDSAESTTTKTWSALFKDNGTNSRKEVVQFDGQAPEMNLHLDQFHVECECFDASHYSSESSPGTDAPLNWVDCREYDQADCLKPSNEELYPLIAEASTSFPHCNSYDTLSVGARQKSQEAAMVHSTTVAEFLTEVEWLKSSHLKQSQKIESLEQDLVESRKEIQQLKDKFKRLEFGISAKPVEAKDSEGKEFHLVEESHPTLDALICMVGGFDGHSWLSNLDLYSSSYDQLKPLASMTPTRKYASATKLYGELYIVGGVESDLWLDTVESYNPKGNHWVSHPPLNQKKGNLGLLSLKDRILAIGGGNSCEFFSEVEMFDPEVGKWIQIQSMLQERSALAVAEVNGTLYVSGGCYEKYYLNSVERLDPRERSWMKLRSMSTKRACHSLATLKGKLYAVGGFDGTAIVPTVEIYEPRTDSWMMGESMNNPRGSFGSLIIGDTIYVIGGLKNVGLGPVEVADTVESYKEHRGWEVTKWRAIGKRSFHSAVLLWP